MGHSSALNTFRQYFRSRYFGLYLNPIGGLAVGATQINRADWGKWNFYLSGRLQWHSQPANDFNGFNGMSRFGWGPHGSEFVPVVMTPTQTTLKGIEAHSACFVANYPPPIKIQR